LPHEIEKLQASVSRLNEQGLRSGRRHARIIQDPHWCTFLGYLILFTEIGWTTLSTYGTRGWKFRTLSLTELSQTLNAKIYAEAKRLG
jgi:hypothetical protein